MANQSLTDLTARTSTADSDLIHVNASGTDYKQTKQNFISDLAQEVTFTTSSTLTSQVNTIVSNKGAGYYFGKIASYGSQSATGVPENDNYYVEVVAWDSNNAKLTVASTSVDKVFDLWKGGGTWGSTWQTRPRRTEIDSLNSSLAKSSVTATPHASITANRLSAYRVGDLVTVSFNMDSGVDFATNSNLVQLGYGAPALIDFTCMNVTDGTPFQLYMTSGGMIRNGATLPSGKRLIGCFSYAVG